MKQGEQNSKERREEQGRGGAEQKCFRKLMDGGEAELMNFRNLDEFWAFYVTQHSKPTTRRLHFIGTILGLLFLLLSLFFNLWLLPLAPFTGYGLAWYSHFFVERNAPATFGHPLWSLLCDFRMFGLMMTGRMEKEIKRLGKRPVLQAF